MSPSVVQATPPDSPKEGFPDDLFQDSLSAHVDEFEASTATSAEITASLIKNGGCVVRNLVSLQDISSIEADVRPWILKDQPSAFKKSSFVLPQTRRVVALPGKSKKFMECVPGNELYQEVCLQLLSSKYQYWVGQSLKNGLSKPHINNTIVFSIAPGAKRQELHRDDMNHHVTLQNLKSHQDYQPGRDVSVGLFVAGKKANKANGVTRFIPRSHLWATSQPPHEDLTVYPTLNPGDAFIMLASCYHGGSANTTLDEERLLFSCFMTKGLLRPVCFLSCVM
jgi:ectoine hydroxylase-related dioxygenase (phytanoyl-CoA dioxygenase family)